MLQTVFCILAIDFPLFPRHAAKTLTYGHSVMDLGVGAVQVLIRIVEAVVVIV